jgi:hypothetical protein
MLPTTPQQKLYLHFQRKKPGVTTHNAYATGTGYKPCIFIADEKKDSRKPHINVFLNYFETILVYLSAPEKLLCHIMQAVAAHEKQMREQAKKMNVASLRSSDQANTSAECKLAKVRKHIKKQVTEGIKAGNI